MRVLGQSSSIVVGQAIECLGNPGSKFLPLGSTVLRSSFPELDAIMPSPSHDAIAGGIGTITSALWQRVIQTSTGVYIAVGSTSASPIARSTDGYTWSYPSVGAIVANLMDVVQAGNNLIAVGTYVSSGNIKSLILISTDWGATWTQKVAGLYTTALQSVAYNGSILCAVGANDTNYYTSADQGATWTQKAGFPINAATVKIRALGSLFVTVNTSLVLNTYWAQFYFYTSSDAVVWATVGLSGGGNTTGTVTPNLSVSPTYIIIQVGSNFYRSSDGVVYTLFDPALSIDTIQGRAKVLPSAITYAAGRYLALGTSKLFDAAANPLKLDILLVSPDCQYWYGIQLKSLPDALIFAGSGDFAVGLGKSSSLHLTFTFDRTKMVLNVPEANKYVKVK